MTQPRGSGPDPIGDFQRWLFRSGARGMSRELGGHIAGTFGLGGKSGDVWQTATAPPPTEAPECAWCPVCRAARLLRASGPGLASQVASASDTLAKLIQDAASVVESAMATAGRQPEPGGPADSQRPARDTAVLPDWDLGSPAGWDAAVPAEQEAAVPAEQEAAVPVEQEAAVPAEQDAAAASEPGDSGRAAPEPADAAGAGPEPTDAEGSVWAEATDNGADPAANGDGNATADGGPTSPEPPA